MTSETGNSFRKAKTSVGDSNALAFIAIGLAVILISTMLFLITKSKRAEENWRQGYLELVESYRDKYGELSFPSVIEMQEQMLWCQNARGLCYTRLLDFNDDGRDEMILVYNKDPQLTTNGYGMEVWSYDKAGKVFCALKLDTTPYVEGVEGASVVFQEYSDGAYLLLRNSETDLACTYYTFDGEEFVRDHALGENDEPDEFSYEYEYGSRSFEDINGFTHVYLLETDGSDIMENSITETVDALS